MKKLLAFLFSFCLISNLWAQVADKDFKIENDTLLGWNNGGMIMLNFSQASFENWSAGGDDMLSYNGLINFFSRYSDGDLSWDNNIDLALGFVKQGSLSRKSDDRIDLTSKLGKSINEKWFYAGLLNFKTQFRSGYNYPNDSVRISKFLAPAYLITALGFDYKPAAFLSIFLAPASGRITIVNDQALSDSGAFGVDPGKKSRFEFGAFAKLSLQKDIFTNVNLSTKFEAFSNYLDNPQNLALNWEILIAMKINEYLGATIATQLVYDEAVINKVQFREIIGVGLSYRF